jgi:protein-disulfide isomerase
MRRPVLPLLLIAAFLPLVFPLAAPGGSESKESLEKSVAALQKQVEELKKNQAQMLDELKELRVLLNQVAERKEFPTKPDGPRMFSINVHGEPFRGFANAKVAIMEYSDFECSFCGKYVRELYPRIDEAYIKTGKIKYFFRDLPAPEHVNSALAAQAARCAGDQGKFWQMHDMLFAAQPAPSETNLTSYASSLGLDMQKFSACFSGGAYADAIRQSANGARSMGLHGTPSFLTGLMSDDGNFLRTTNVIVGIESFDALKESVDELLATPKRQ